MSLVLVLDQDWMVVLCAGMVGAALVSLVVAALYEGLKSLRDWMQYWNEKQPETNHGGRSYSSEMSDDKTDDEKIPLLTSNTERSHQLPMRFNAYYYTNSVLNFQWLLSWLLHK